MPPQEREKWHAPKQSMMTPSQQVKIWFILLLYETIYLSTTIFYKFHWSILVPNRCWWKKISSTPHSGSLDEIIYSKNVLIMEFYWKYRTSINWYQISRSPKLESSFIMLFLHMCLPACPTSTWINVVSNHLSGKRHIHLEIGNATSSILPSDKETNH